MAAFAIPAQTCCVAVIAALLWRARAHDPWWSRLHEYLLLSAVALGAWCVIDVIRGQANLLAYRRVKKHWPQLAAAALRVVVWLLIAFAVDLAMPTEEFRYQAESRTRLWIAASVLVMTALLPRQRRWAPSDVLFAMLLVVVGVDLARISEPRVANALDIRPPLDQLLYIRNGGTSPLVNDHAGLPGGAWAVDVYPFTDDGSLCDGEELAAFPCFGARVLAPVAGRITHVVRDRPDMPLGRPDRATPNGNSVSIQTEDGRYLLLAHLKQSTILVSEGEQVEVGQEIARCGNSGAAGVPHLLLQAQDRPLAPSGDAGTYPLRFINAARLREQSITFDPFVVRRNDIIHRVAGEREE